MKRPGLTFVIGLLLLGGCQGSHTINEGPAYPTDIQRVAPVDVQVLRHGTEIQMTNTSGLAFGPSRLWLNGRFSYDIPAFNVGQTIELDLADFKDQYGDVFKGGGFFAIERAERLALAELQSDGRLYGLVVIGGLEP